MAIVRRYWLALIISILGPGVGYLYLGQARKSCIVWGAIIFALPLVFLVGRINVYLLIFLQFLVPLIYLYSIIHTLGLVRSSLPTPSKWYQKWYWYALALIISPTAIFLEGKLARYWIAEPFKIPSSSMYPALRIGDHVLADKLQYLNSPVSRGDIVVFKRNDDPRTKLDESSIIQLKRVVAIGGDRIRLEGTHLYLNGEEIDERRYAYYTEGGKFPLAEQVVPPNSVLLLGDNRDESKDSRFYTPPSIPIEKVLGKIIFVYWPQSRIGIRPR